MAYRENILCAYCEGSEVTCCARCRCRLCAEHQPASDDGWCWACTKEIKDELDVLDFESIVKVPMEHREDGSEIPSPSWIALRRWVGSFRKRRVKKALIERSREEIAAWRLRAGVTTRW